MTEPRPIERERALTALEEIRTALLGDDLQGAIKQIDTLQTLLADWKRSEARLWLDTALDGDLLSFNIDAANQRLSQWESAVPGDQRDITYYRERVTDRNTKKQTELQVRGVIAHCEELWRKAEELERAEPPSRPEYLLTAHYERARDVAVAAVAEHSGVENLDLLLQKAEGIRQRKIEAGRLYKDALEKELYGVVLEALTQLTADDLIPRYRVIMDAASKDMTTFDRMVTASEAREEMERLGKLWAADKAQTYLQTGAEALAAFHPQLALDSLNEREALERFLKEDIKLALRDLERRAKDDLRLLEQAERRARQAIRLADDNPVGAWTLYAEAYQTYEGAPSLGAAHEAIVAALLAALETQVTEAEQALNAKQMERVTIISKDAHANFAEKDAALEPLLSRMEEIQWQAQTYQEYLQNAGDIVSQIQVMLTRDVVQAGELLGQLESYPPVVLEELADLPSIRAEVRRKLNAEVLYNQLYKLLLSDELAAIQRGMALAAEKEEEPRFQQLQSDLELHIAFLNAKREQTAGRSDKALTLLEMVAETTSHPDKEASQALIDEIRTDPEE